ncbi:hypothetical protein [Streptomyces flavofungini]|uniref:hypothetical protein n=1 Tax=Streptomyces flavofungini TaxID=68200 RepID=UPI0025B14855|nr:hypothetical protein [Streptomyces flavofungini]WJV46490.1 hypothetical protein QUY26_13690 [Streptomyces flavofungini]
MRKSWWGAGSAAVAVFVGVAAWQLWPSDETAVSVPARVCDGSLPAKAAAQILPKSGKRYFEYINGTGFGTAFRSGEAPPTCTFTGGGQRIRVEYNRHFNEPSLEIMAADDARKRVRKESKSPGKVSLSIGESYGYASSHGAALLLDCRDDGDTGIIEVSVDARTDSSADSSDTKAFAELAAETLRMATRHVYRCDNSTALPAGPPTLDAPRKA